MTVAPTALQSLRFANRIRQERAEAKRALRAQPSRDASLEAAAEHVLNPSPALRRMTARDLILACHRSGRATAHRVLRHADVNGERRLGELTERERQALSEVLRGER